MIKYFNSPNEMARLAMTECASTEAWNNSRVEWSGPRGAELTAMLEKGGDDSDVPAARALLEKFEMEFPETDRSMFVPSVAGAYPCVPDALLGMPESMRVKTIVFNSGSPIKLGVVTTISAGIKTDAYRKRSAAMLAILMHLQNTGRAIELYSISMLHGQDTGETVLITRIPSVPLSLAESNMATGNLAFSRRIPFAISKKFNNFNGAWPTKFSNSDNGITYCQDLAKRTGFQMILPPLHRNEADKVKADPVKWMLAKYEAIQAAIDEDLIAA